MLFLRNSARLVFFTLFLTLVACTDATSGKPVESKQKYQYQIPDQKNDGWQVGHIDDQQIDSLVISKLTQDIIDGVHPGIDSLSIVRNNTLVYHQNFRSEFTQYDDWVGNNKLDSHPMHSTSKSFASALIGIAIDQGYIADTTTPFLNFFDYPTYANWSEQKQQLTLDNVLTMQLGLSWDEWTFPFGDTRNSLTQLTDANQDFVKALLDLPMDSPAGKKFNYNTIASVALGLVVEKSTGMPMEDFAQIYLFEPLQINHANWLMTPDGYPNAGSGLVLPSRDMAKLGQLYLNKGQWNGLQVMSPQWVAQSLKHSADIKLDFTIGYGYQWWLGDFVVAEQKIPFYSTRGYGGQFIIIVPDFQLVIAFTAHNYENGLYDYPFHLVEQIILPAIH